MVHARSQVARARGARPSWRTGAEDAGGVSHGVVQSIQPLVSRSPTPTEGEHPCWVVSDGLHARGRGRGGPRAILNLLPARIRGAGVQCGMEVAVSVPCHVPALRTL